MSAYFTALWEAEKKFVVEEALRQHDRAVAAEKEGERLTARAEFTEKAFGAVVEWLEKRGVNGMAYQLTTLRDIVSATLDSGPRR